jgi:anaerobic selenocysteine-containing dehydrogenase
MHDTRQSLAAEAHTHAAYEHWVADYQLKKGEHPFRIVHTVCSHDCPDSCGVLVTVNEEGRAIKVAGDPAHPVTQGFLCGKVAKYLDRVYAPVEDSCIR